MSAVNLNGGCHATVYCNVVKYFRSTHCTISVRAKAAHEKPERNQRAIHFDGPYTDLGRAMRRTPEATTCCETRLGTGRPGAGPVAPRRSTRR